MIVSLALPPTAGAAEYHVSPTGSDANAGTLTAPLATIAQALKRAGAGDTITLRAGTYAENARLRHNNITLRSFPGERAVLRVPTNDEANFSAVVFIDRQASGSTLQGLEIVGGYYYGVMLQSNWDSGGPDRSGASDILIEDCIIHDTGRDAVKITPGCDDVTIRRCTIYNSGVRDKSNAEGIDNVNGARMLVQDCFIHDIATTGIYAKGGAIGTVIERCLIMNTGGMGVAMGFDTSPEWFDKTVNPQYYENINGTLRNCIIVNTALAGVGIYAALNAKIYNNTIVNTATGGQSAIHFGLAFHDRDASTPCPGAINPVLRNNIVAQLRAIDAPLVQIRHTSEHGGIAGLEGPLTMSNNRYYVAGGRALFEDGRTKSTFRGGLADWQAHVSSDADSTEGPPGLDAQYHLDAASGCIDAGYALGAMLKDDYDGNARGATPDIGADEYGAGPVLAVPPAWGAAGTGGGSDTNSGRK